MRVVMVTDGPFFKDDQEEQWADVEGVSRNDAGDQS